jgi:hypothetical protein
MNAILQHRRLKKKISTTVKDNNPSNPSNTGSNTDSNTDRQELINALEAVKIKVEKNKPKYIIFK